MLSTEGTQAEQEQKSVPSGPNGDECFVAFPDDEVRRLRIPLRMETDSPRGFHDDERMVYYGYWDDGSLLSVQDTEQGKRLYPIKQPVDPVIGRYNNSTVYFIQAATGEIKIGIATDPNVRVRDLQVGSPVRLSLLVTCPGGRPQESAYHSRFARHRIHGEWFNPHPDILAEIDRLTLDYKGKQ